MGKRKGFIGALENFRLSWIAILLSVLVVLVVISGLVVISRSNSEPKSPSLRIVFSPAPGVDPETVKIAYGGIAEALEAELGIKVVMLSTTSYEATTVALENGDADIARLGGRNLIQAQDRFGVVPLVTEVNLDGVSEYHGIIVGHPGRFEEPFTWEQLKGKTMIFPDIGSTSGYLANVANMLNHGIALDDLGQWGFAGSHPAVLEIIMAGAVDAGGTNDWRTELAITEGAGVEGEDFVILAVSPPIPMNCWAASTAMKPEMRARIAKVLLNLSEKAFENSTQIKGFVPPLDYSYIRELMELESAGG